MEYERALRISLERTRPHKYFLGKNGFYWNPETGEISLDPGKNVPQSMQLPLLQLLCAMPLNNFTMRFGSITFQAQLRKVANILNYRHT